VLRVSVTFGDDLALVEGLRDGDESAFINLVERYQSALIRLARLYVHDGAAAEDVVQETWLAVVRGIERFEGRAALKTWLFRILVNRARTRAARDAQTLPFASLPDAEMFSEPAVPPARFRPADDPHWPGHWLIAPSADDLPEERLLADELQERVRAVVAELPPTQQAVVSLRDIEGLTSTEVCQLLDLSEANQRVLLHRGRSRVRAALEEYLSGQRLAGQG
jgi:RNA polymerase sigma-70 factor (ECF subfamily)